MDDKQRVITGEQPLFSSCPQGRQQMSAAISTHHQLPMTSARRRPRRRPSSRKRDRLPISTAYPPHLPPLRIPPTCSLISR